MASVAGMVVVHIKYFGSMKSWLLFWKLRRKLCSTASPPSAANTRRRQTLGVRQGRLSLRFSPSVWRKENRQRREGEKHQQMLQSSAWKLRWINVIFCGKRDLFLLFYFQLVHPPSLAPILYSVGWIRLGMGKERKYRKIKTHFEPLRSSRPASVRVGLSC